MTDTTDNLIAPPGKMHDSGVRQQFETSAVRDSAAGKPRPDLISPFANLREGEWLRLGAEKYAERNWEAGIPISRCIASICRHIEQYKAGDTSEDHMAAIRCNAGFIIHFEEMVRRGVLPDFLLDMPYYSRLDDMEGTKTITVADNASAHGDVASVAPVAWFVTHTGRIIDFLDPDPNAISIEDIAHSLAGTPRYNAHTMTPIYLSSHCLTVAALLSKYQEDHQVEFEECHRHRLALLGLLHDAEEAYTGDIVRGLKLMLSDELAPIVERIRMAIFTRFEIDPPTLVEKEIIKDADNLALAAERHLYLSEAAKSTWQFVVSPTADALKQTRFNVGYETGNWYVRETRYWEIFDTLRSIRLTSSCLRKGETIVPVTKTTAV